MKKFFSLLLFAVFLTGLNTKAEDVKGTTMSSDKQIETSTKQYTKPADEVLKAKLTDLQYKVTQKEGTEPPFKNDYWDNNRDGIYVDVVTGEPLFSSLDKYDSGTGWPSFSKPLVTENVTEKEDFSLFSKRTEVRSKNGDSHLGHVFDDGPKPTGTALLHELGGVAVYFC